jgi:hypothetical protein
VNQKTSKETIGKKFAFLLAGFLSIFRIRRFDFLTSEGNMKKLLYSIVLVLALTALIAVPVFAATTISPTILVGQHENAGSVKITRNGDGTMTLEWMLKGGQGYCMTEWQVHAGASLADFPTNKGGAIPGQFDYKSSFTGCVARDTLTIDPPGDVTDDVFLAVHIVVITPDGDEETGWVVRCGDLEGAQFPGRNWSAWVYFPG